MFARSIRYSIVLPLLFTAPAHAVDGGALYADRCARCHGAEGEGVKGEFGHPLTGEDSLEQVTRYIDKYMPGDDAKAVVGEDAEAVAAYIYDAFHSPKAQTLKQQVRIVLSRMTVRQYQNAVADLIAAFRWSPRGESAPGFAADHARIATLQITNSVGQAKMRWLDIDAGHHSLSHEPDKNEDAQEKLTRINRWYCEQLAYLAKRLSETPEPGGTGSLLDNTVRIWTNELGKGNTHTLNDMPFILVGGGLGFSMGRALKLKEIPHNRLLLALAHGFGHRIEHFGNPDYCGAGPLSLG